MPAPEEGVLSRGCVTEQNATEDLDSVNQAGGRVQAGYTPQALCLPGPSLIGGLYMEAREEAGIRERNKL